MTFQITEGENFQLDDEGNPIAPDAGAASVAMPATQGGVIGAGKRASDGKPAIIRTDDDGRQTINADALPLPSGAATAARQDTGNTSLGNIDTSTASSAASLVVIDTVLDSIDNKVALAATQTDGTQKSIARGGAKGTTTAADITSQDVDANRQAMHVQITPGTEAIGAVFIQDPSTSDRALVTNAGQLRVTTDAAPPPGFDEVRRSITGDLAGSTTENDVYVIPNGKELTITRIACTSHASSSGDKACLMELFHDPNGNGDANMVLLRSAVTSNSAEEFTTAATFLGDGTMAIRLRRTSLDSQTRRCDVYWSGVVEQ